MSNSAESIDFVPFDADHHYYEAMDAFTRHLDPKFGHRTVQWAEISGRMQHIVGGQVARAVRNPLLIRFLNPVCFTITSEGGGLAGRLWPCCVTRSPFRPTTEIARPGWPRWTNKDWTEFGSFQL